MVTIVIGQDANSEGMQLDREAWKELKEGRAYDPPEGLEKKEKKPIEEVKEFDSIDAPSFEVPSALLYGIVIVIAIVVVILILKKVLQPNKLKEERIEATSIEDAEENLPDVTLNKIHQEALETGDFKSALRIKFLMLLQVLIDEKHIQWKKRKTNEQYMRELTHDGQKYEFDQIVSLYDKVWYGSGTITEVQYQLVSRRIENMKTNVSNE